MSIWLNYNVIYIFKQAMYRCPQVSSSVQNKDGELLWLLWKKTRSIGREKEKSVIPLSPL